MEAYYYKILTVYVKWHNMILEYKKLKMSTINRRANTPPQKTHTSHTAITNKSTVEQNRNLQNTQLIQKKAGKEGKKTKKE